MLKMDICANPHCNRVGQLVQIRSNGFCGICTKENHRKTKSLCVYCKKNAWGSRSKISNEFVCHDCKRSYRHLLFLRGIIQSWGPKHENCILCKCTDLAHARSGYCNGCYTKRRQERFCDKCSNPMGRNFCTPYRSGGYAVEDKNESYEYLCKPCSMLFDFPWAFGYKNCKSCQQSDSPHYAKGLCASCYTAEDRYGTRTCEWCGNTETHRSFFNPLVVCSP